ncbi:MAG: hypothetical protein IK018_11660 [Lachnospiraceae bacterium]|nr:hypothetical protein [Lachnospiraceae bacterium]
MNNEDYLDSLLRAAVAEDNPNSAINKVRKIESEMPKEQPIEETTEAADEELSGAIDDSLTEEYAEDIPADIPVDIPENIAEEVVAVETPEEPIIEEPIIEEPATVTEEVPVVVTEEIPVEIPAETVAEVPSEVMPEEIPAEVPEAPAEAPTEAVTDIPADALADIPADLLADIPTEDIAEVPAEDLVVEPVEEIAAEALDIPADVLDTPVETLDAPAEEITEALADLPAEDNLEALADIPTEESVEGTEGLDGLEGLESLEGLGDLATDLNLEGLSDIAADVGAEVPADIPSDESLDALGDIPADLLADFPTEEISETPAEEGTTTEEIATEEPIDILGEALPEEPAAETEATEPTDEATGDIDSLLSSDFAGEVDIADVSSLLESAEEFAAKEAESTQNLTDESSEALDMSGEDIEKMLSEAADVSIDEGAQEGEIAVDLDDIASMEGELGIYDKNDITEGLSDAELGGDGGELAEISSLLAAIDNNDAGGSDDMLEMLNEAVSKQEAEDEAAAKAKAEARAEAEAAARAEEALNGDKKSKKKGLFSFLKKKDKEEAPADPNKKKSKFQKLLDFLTAEDEEEEALIKPVDAAEGEAATGENKEILEEIDKEGDDSKGKKKKKKKKGKKGKDEEGGEDKGEGDEDSEEGGDKKGKKKKKPPKEKKERKPLELDIDTGKPLSKRNIKLVAVLAATLLLAIILVCTLIPKVIVNSTARKAYYRGDYETTYNSFFGEKKLSDSDAIIFKRSEIVLKMLHKYDAFKTYSKIDMQAEALDQLLQAVNNYEPWLIAAESCGAADEFKEAYSKCLGALISNYGLTEEAAKAINALPTDQEYSLMVHSIVTGTEYIDPTAPLPAPFVEPESTVIDDSDGEGDILDEEGN